MPTILQKTFGVIISLYYENIEYDVEVMILICGVLLEEYYNKYHNGNGIFI
jgi:hypothetical protein